MCSRTIQYNCIRPGLSHVLGVAYSKRTLQGIMASWRKIKEVGKNPYSTVDGTYLRLSSSKQSFSGLSPLRATRHDLPNTQFLRRSLFSVLAVSKHCLSKPHIHTGVLHARTERLHERKTLVQDRHSPWRSHHECVAQCTRYCLPMTADRQSMTFVERCQSRI